MTSSRHSLSPPPSCLPSLEVLDGPDLGSTAETVVVPAPHSLDVYAAETVRASVVSQADAELLLGESPLPSAPVPSVPPAAKSGPAPFDSLSRSHRKGGHRWGSVAWVVVLIVVALAAGLAGARLASG